ncbi:hypothetical protein Lal_00027074 [Lupinus albus]|nr:hypothetical protein Lal_00027074 [Lupinus albus]
MSFIFMRQTPLQYSSPVLERPILGNPSVIPFPFPFPPSLNRNLGFVGAIEKYPNGERFLKVKAEYDSIGLFSSEWTDQVLGLKEEVTILKDGCALEELCICSQDSHCAPNHGYFCKPGRIYKDGEKRCFVHWEKR